MFSGTLRILAQYELVVQLAIAPLMLFPGWYTPLTVFLIAALWVARWRVTGSLSRFSPLNLPLIIIVLMSIIGYFVSVDRTLSEPKLWGIVLQAAVFFSALNGLSGEKDINRLATLIPLITLGVALVSLVGTNWNIVRLVQLPWFYDNIPTLIRDMPDSGLSPADDLFHPRQVGATMGMLLPFVTVMLFVAGSWPSRVLAGLAFVSGIFVLFLSQAIMGVFGALVGWLILLVVWRRWLLVPIAGALIGIGVILISQANTASLLSRLLAYDDLLGIGLILRLDMWSRALAMMADLPFTGIGINTYPLIQSHFYTGFGIGPEPHAHNLFLQTAVDLGIPGLLALLWLLIVFTIMVIKSVRNAPNSQWRWVQLGIGASVAAYVAGGVLDTMTLGAKPVLILFLFMGMAGAINWLTFNQGSEKSNMNYRALSTYLPVSFYLIGLAIIVLVRPESIATNRALISAHQVIYSARLSGQVDAISVAVTERVNEALEKDSRNAELLGGLGSLLSIRGQQAEAAAVLEKRMTVDAGNPLESYAPFIQWQRQLAGEQAATPGEDLLRVYSQWQTRFPVRAEGYVLVALVYDRLLQSRQAAIDTIQRGIDQQATPSGLLTFFYDKLASRVSE